MESTIPAKHFTDNFTINPTIENEMETTRKKVQLSAIDRHVRRSTVDFPRKQENVTQTQQIFTKTTFNFTIDQRSKQLNKTNELKAHYQSFSYNR